MILIKGRCSLKEHLCAIDTTQKKLCELTFITNDELCNGIDDCPLHDDEDNCRKLKILIYFYF